MRFTITIQFYILGDLFFVFGKRAIHVCFKFFLFYLILFFLLVCDTAAIRQVCPRFLGLSRDERTSIDKQPYQFVIPCARVACGRF